jgi:hypothetical protein
MRKKQHPPLRAPRREKSISRLGMGVLMGGVAFVGVQHGYATTMVHNNGFTGNDQALPNNPNYASNVSASGANWDAAAGAQGIVGTPDIVLNWLGAAPGGGSGARWETYTNWDGRGNVIQMDGDTGVLPKNLAIEFAPAAGAGVLLNSFDLDEWSGGGSMSVEWSLAGPISGTLASGTWNRNTGGRDTISPSAGAGAIGETLTLSLSQTSGAISYLALDNLTFDQVVPEPASAAVAMAGGLGALAMRRRRRD